MSSAPPEFPPVRRQDKLMSDDDARDMLAKGRYGCVATVSADGSPYTSGMSI